MTIILIVEDDTVIRDNVALELEMQDYEVIQADNGKHALSLIDDNAVALIISDISMPEMDGLELLEYVRSNPPLAQIPFIFMSAFNNEDSTRKAESLGADGYIGKPFKLSELSSLVEEILHRG